MSSQRQASESLLLRSILNSSPAGVMAFNAIRDDRNAIIDFEVIMANRKAEQISGRRESDLLGKALGAEFPTVKRTGLFERYLTLVEGGEPFHTVLRYQGEGIDSWLDVYAEKIYDGFVLTFYDITRVKQAEEELIKMNEELEQRVQERTQALNQSQEQLRISIETAELGTWECDLTTGILQCSERCCEMLGLPGLQPLHAKMLEKYVHSDDVGRLKKVVQGFAECRHDETHGMELRMLRPDNNHLVWVKLKWKVYLNEQNCPVKLTGIAMDITESMEAKEILRDQLNKKEEFIGIASHELKTPLTSIKGYVQLMDESVRNGQYDRLPLFVKKTDANVRKLSELINDLLDVSKIQAGKLTYNFEEFDFDEMLRESIESVQYTSPTHTITLEQSVNVRYFGDKMRLEQVMNNFLTNAIKYSPNANRVIVNAEIIKNHIVVSVKDFGIGIAPENMSKLFDRFYRIDNTSTRFSGLGLGLYISSEILKRHKGTFWIDSEVNKGSTFYFLLPQTEYHGSGENEVRTGETNPAP